jgi:hypothetical protein
MGAEMGTSTFLALLAEAQLASDKLAECLVSIKEGLAISALPASRRSAASGEKSQVKNAKRSASRERFEAKRTLAKIYGWFTEGFNTPDLKAAKELLDQLS